MSRFRLLDKTRLPIPSQCCVCGSGERDCVDFGKQEDWYGAVLICTSCFRAAADQIPELELLPLNAFKDYTAGVESKIATADKLIQAWENFRAKQLDILESFSSDVSTFTANFADIVNTADFEDNPFDEGADDSLFDVDNSNREGSAAAR